MLVFELCKVVNAINVEPGKVARKVVNLVEFLCNDSFSVWVFLIATVLSIEIRHLIGGCASVE